MTLDHARRAAAVEVSFEELGRIVRRDGPLPPERAVALVRRAARVIADAQTAGLRPDTRSEVFGLGAVLFFALTGKAPLEEDSAEPLDIALSPSMFSPHPLCSALDAVVRTCLRDLPGERFASAMELSVALAALPYADSLDTN
jgi:hypothetical protein